MSSEAHSSYSARVMGTLRGANRGDCGSNPCWPKEAAVDPRADLLDDGDGRDRLEPDGEPDPLPGSPNRTDPPRSLRRLRDRWLRLTRTGGGSATCPSEEAADEATDDGSSPPPAPPPAPPSIM